MLAYKQYPEQHSTRATHFNFLFFKEHTKKKITAEGNRRKEQATCKIKELEMFQEKKKER